MWFKQKKKKKFEHGAKQAPGSNGYMMNNKSIQSIKHESTQMKSSSVPLPPNPTPLSTLAVPWETHMHYEGVHKTNNIWLVF